MRKVGCQGCESPPLCKRCRRRQRRRAGDARYREKNRLAVRARAREWARRERQRNPEAIRIIERRWRATHIEEARAKGRAYRERNRALVRERERARWPQRRDAKLKANKEWRQAHPERVRELRRRWARNNRDKVNAGTRRRRAKHPEIQREAQRQWRARHPLKWLEVRDRRLAKRRGASYVEPVDRREVYRRSGGRCAYCSERISPRGWHLDHVVPLLHGGAHSMGNVVASCRQCNQSKGAKLNWVPKALGNPTTTERREANGTAN